MLSRTAASLYWLGRYIERADFTARLVEATVRLDALSSRPAGSIAWESSLTVIEALEEYKIHHQVMNLHHVAPFLTTSMQHPGSIARCLESARSNARAVRTALSREAWSAINSAWHHIENSALTPDDQSVLMQTQLILADTQSFTGALHRMLHHPTTMFIHLGMAIERADNTARLLDVKYHIILPEGEQVGGTIDRDQWNTILQTVSARNAYRWLYSDGLRAANVIELLTLRPELPRSLLACSEKVVEQLADIANVTGLFSVADSLAKTRLANLKRSKVTHIIGEGLHEYLEDFLTQNIKLDEAIAFQFRF